MQTLLALLTVALLTCGCETQQSTTQRFAQTAPNPWRGEHYKCRPFAETLCAALVARGVEAHVVHYLTWSGENHLFVAYQDGGQWHGQDQFCSWLLFGTDAQSWSESFSGTHWLEFAFIERPQ